VSDRSHRSCSDIPNARSRTSADPLFGSLPGGRRVRVVAVEEKNRVVIVTIIDEER
jgi:hypothetical protein